MKHLDRWKKVKFLQKNLVIFLLMLTATISLSPGTSKADLTEMEKLIPSDGAYADYFGKSVSIDGDYAIVGAPSDDEGVLLNTGCAYIFQRSGNDWIQAKKLLAPDRAHNDTFGASVSISGDYAIVGKPFDDNTISNSGSAYIFKRNGSDWEQVAKLQASDPGANNYFGSSVAINGDYAIVGAPMDDDNGSDSGSAYIFHRSDSTWQQVAKLIPAELSGGDYFGYAVAIKGDNVVVGAPRDDNENGTDAGCIYFFKRTGESWTEFPAVPYIDSYGAAGDQFGWSVSINGQFAIGGANYHDGSTLQDSGTARIFEDAWGIGLWRTLDEQLLVPLDRAASDQFGFSVSISGETAVVGTLKYINGNGSVYVFRKSSSDDSWSQSEKLVASDNPWGFGSAVAVSGRYVVVGAQHDANSAGSAYIFDLAAQPASTLVPRYRLYNPNNGHHHYTTNSNEYSVLGSLGWAQEGMSCYLYNGTYQIGAIQTAPYYRLYNPNSGEHHWTTDANEYQFLGTIGWRQEGVDGHVFASQVTGSQPLYRLYNPNAGLHHWTMDANERSVIIGYGWNDEGIACYVFP